MKLNVDFIRTCDYTREIYNINKENDLLIFLTVIYDVNIYSQVRGK